MLSYLGPREGWQAGGKQKRRIGADADADADADATIEIVQRKWGEATIQRHEPQTPSRQIP